MITSSIVRSSVLLEQNNGFVDPIKTLENVNNESYTAEAIEFMRSMNEEYLNQSKILYKSLLESTDTYVVHESFSDFFGWIKKIIDKAIAFIKKMYDKFINFIMKLFKSDSYIKKNKSKISEFSGEFDIEGYKFTISSDIPKTDKLFAIDDSIQIDRNTNAKDLATKCAKLKEDMDDILGKQRATILGKAGSIDESDFHDECFETYRDGDSDTQTITINSTDAMESYRRFENYEKTVKEAKKECKEIVKAYTDLAKLYDKMVGKLHGEKYDDVHVVDSTTGTAKDKDEFSKELGVQADIYAKLNSSFFNKLITAYNMAYTTKLDALKAQYNQDKAICYRAINKANSK